MPYFTIQDVVGAIFAFLLFFAVFLFPGYVVGFLFDLLDFRDRSELSKIIFAIVISASIVPITIYLLSLVLTLVIAKYSFILLFVVFFYLKIEDIKNVITKKIFPPLNKAQKYALLIAIGWLFLTILMMVDIQWGDRLYFNVISLDFATRVSLVDAMTRTGIPPVNPSYFPGHLEYINSLYYFWYILCSVIDQFGGDIVDARMALIGGDIWIGIILMALIAVYLKFRNVLNNQSAWKIPLIGIGLLLISGLDFVPAIINMIVTRISFGVSIPFGDIEHWNEQITAWAGSLLWVPHHIAAMVGCVFALSILCFSGTKKSLLKKIPLYVVCGLSLASAIGLSTWVAIVFAFFLGIASFILFVSKLDKSLAVEFGLIGLVALIFSSPFLAGVFQGGTGAEGAPIIFEVRKLLPISPYVSWMSDAIENLIFLFLLPINYLMELGFFFIVGLIWLKEYRTQIIAHGTIKILEITLLTVVVIVCTFVRSAIVPSNEIGWRGWLFGQFILLVWTIDLFEIPSVTNSKYRKMPSYLEMFNIRTQKFLRILIIGGLITSVVDLTLIRIWPILIDLNVAGFPNQLSPDTQLGKRTYASRLAYEFIRDNLSAAAVIQQNPLGGIDRPSGLYGTRQFAISLNAPYNVPLNILNDNKYQISRIFMSETRISWGMIDSICENYYIDVIIVDDVDPLWNQLAELSLLRSPIYSNNYYSIFLCGKMIRSNP